MKVLRAVARGYRWWRRKQSTLPFRLFRGFMHGISFVALFLVCLATIVSREINPFYSWIRETPFEATGRYVVGVLTRQTLVWRRRLASLPLLPAGERAKEHFVSEIVRVRPTHAIELNDGRTFVGRLERQADEKIEFEYQDEEGHRRVEYDENDVERIIALDYAPIVLTPRDVRFLSNYPEFDYYHLPPYLFVSSATYPLVHEAYAILNALSREFRNVFGPLVVTERSDNLIYVCIFKDEATYLDHAAGSGDVDLSQSIGFYSQGSDCLFVYDRLKSLARANVDRSVNQLISESRLHGSAPYARRVRHFAEAERERLYDVLRAQVVNTLRHEGAHELAFSLGVHSSEGFEHLWLQEGLAQYCESVPMGALIPEQMKLLVESRADGKLIDWDELVNTPNPTGFASYGDRTNQAYAQSWLLFRHCMQPALRVKFFAYAIHVRKMTPAQLERRRTAILEEYLELPFTALVEQLEETIRTRGAAQR